MSHGSKSYVHLSLITICSLCKGVTHCKQRGRVLQFCISLSFRTEPKESAQSIADHGTKAYGIGNATGKRPGYGVRAPHWFGLALVRLIAYQSTPCVPLNGYGPS